MSKIYWQLNLGGVIATVEFLGTYKGFNILLHNGRYYDSTTIRTKGHKGFETLPEYEKAMRLILRTDRIPNLKTRP